MQVTIREVGYEIRPYSKGPCWQLYRLVEQDSDGATKERWRPLDYYPSTLRHGLENIAERALRDSKVSGDLQMAIAEMRRLSRIIQSAFEGPQPVE